MSRSIRDSPEVMDLIASMLRWNPIDRATAESGLEAWERRNPERTWSSTPSVRSATLPLDPGGASSQKPASEWTGMGSAGAEAVSILAPSSRGIAESEAGYAPSGTMTPQDSSQNKSGIDTQSAPMCKCSGNCGNRSCMRKRRALYSKKRDSEQPKKRRAAQICEMITSAPGQWCRNCTCAQDGCNKARSRLTHLCHRHLQELSKIAKGTHYMSPNGPRKLDEAWSEEVKLIAIHGWMLKDMCPGDVEAFSAALDKLIGAKAKLTGYDLLNGYVVAVLKLPEVVLEWVGLTLAGTETVTEAVSKSDSRSKLRTAADYTTATIKLAAIVDRMDARWQCQQLMGGSQQSVFGLRKLLTNLDMIPTNPARGATIAPGPQYREHMWANLTKIAEDFDKRYPDGLSLPKTVEETLLFAKRVAEFLAEFPKNFGHGKSDDVDLNSGYIRKCIVRKFIVWARRHTPSDIWDAWTLEQVLMVTPDKLNLLEGVTKTWNGHQIKRNFAVSSFMLSCWACLFHAVDNKYREALLTPSVQLQQLCLQMKQENKGCEPSMRTLGRLFVD